MDVTEVVRAYYDADVELEWVRLQNHPVERILNQRFLTRYIQPGEHVLDMGGGPGRYALWLAEMGCDVTLADLSPANVAFAKAKAAEMGLPLRAVQADAREPVALAGEQFDHVLLMGPMYHLPGDEDRRCAVRASLSLLKPGGTLSVAFISAFAGVIYAMKYEPSIILDPAMAANFELAARNLPFAGAAFTEAYFARREDIVPFMEQHPLETLHLLGSESVLAPNEATMLEQSPEILSAWVDFAERVCEREDLLMYSEHYLYVGRKRL